MIHAKNYEKLSKFVEVTAKKLSVLFSDTMYIVTWVLEKEPFCFSRRS